MDLVLYLKVLWRFRLLMAAGIALGAFVFVQSALNVQFNGLKMPSVSHKEQTLWQSEARLLVTQKGFPWGRSVVNESVPVNPRNAAEGWAPRFADAARFTSLAIIYMHIATSDPVRELVERDGPLNGTIDAAPVTAPDQNSYLPMVNVAGVSTSPEAAADLANRAAKAFQDYLGYLQETNGIPEKQRVQIPIVKRAVSAELFSKPSIVRPMFLFVLIVGATVVLAFLLENAKRRPRAAEVEPPAPELELPRVLSSR